MNLYKKIMTSYIYLVPGLITKGINKYYQVLEITQLPVIEAGKDISSSNNQYFTVKTTSTLLTKNFTELESELLNQALKKEEEEEEEKYNSHKWKVYYYVSILPEMYIDLEGYEIPLFENTFIKDLILKISKPHKHDFHNPKLYSPKSTVRTLNVERISNSQMVNTTKIIGT